MPRTPQVLSVAGAIVCLALAASAYAASPARLHAHAVYGGVTAKKDAFVNLKTASATAIAASPVNTAPELRHSNINLACSNKAQVNSGMPATKLALAHGSYSFASSFTRTAKETPPGSGSVTLKIKLTGKVVNSKTISGTVEVNSSGGCSIPSQSYTAKLST